MVMNIVDILEMMLVMAMEHSNQIQAMVVFKLFMLEIGSLIKDLVMEFLISLYGKRLHYQHGGGGGGGVFSTSLKVLFTGNL